MEFLFAPTVPSDPKPQNLHEVVSLGVVSGLSFTSRERFVTSSTNPIVKRRFGKFEDMLLYTAMMSPGSVSFELRPYLPVYTGIDENFVPANAAKTSK